MDSDSIWQHIDEQRAILADMVDGIDSARWSTPSLCEGWTVRDVAAHLTHSHMSKPRMMLEALRSGFRFNAMIHRVAVQDTRSPTQIAAALRGMCGSRRRPPGTAECDPLMDVLVHGQDIAVPLGIDLPMPADAAAAAARRLWGMRFPFNPQRRLRGVELIATDTDFRVGNGRVVEAPIRDILMLFAGRPSAISALAGSLSDR
ncbi:MAG TPA: maleylpyruvate isomerase family mycothiol-dependent enzyme [Mycobacterium sp.]|nr:maleylpyruvate isomerase family mycothiol-dependent enzyme [Mycobacterium sp.]